MLVENAEYIKKERVLSEINSRLQMLQQVTDAIHSSIDLNEVLKNITDGAVNYLGYNTVLIVIVDNDRKNFVVRTLSSKKKLLPKINKILGFSLSKFSFPADPNLSAAIKSVTEGRILITKTLAEAVYPLISKKTCSLLQKLGKSKSCIIMPLKIENEIAGGMLLTTTQKEISKQELDIIESFSLAASNAIKNARLHLEVKQATQARQQSEELFRSIVENSHAGILMADESYRFVYVNDELCRLVGYEREELIGRDFRHLLDDESRQLVIDRYRRRQRGEDVPSRYEFNVVRKDGQKRRVEISSTVIKDKKGRIRTVAQLLDITERKRSEEKLQLEKARLDKLFESAQEGIVMTDTEGKVIRVNREFTRMFGYQPEEVLGKSVDELVVPKEALKTGLSITKKIAKGKKVSFEAVRQRKDGTLIDVSILSSPIVVNGKIVAIYAIYRDITERKKGEKIQAAIYKISDAALRLKSLGRFYSLIHKTVAELMPAENFYIALYDQESEMINFPYFVDKYEGNPGPYKPGKGLTEYVLKTGKPLLASPEVCEELENKGEVVCIGPPSVDWLGVPLKTRDRTFGLIVVQSYTEGIRYTQKDKEILSYFAEQVAMAIERKRAEEQLQRQTSILKAINRVFHETLVCETEEEVAQTCLSVAEELTGSQFGFIGKVNERGRMDTIAQSDTGWKACKIPKSDAILMINNMEIRGLWGKVLKEKQPLIANDPASYPERVGTPEGHPPIKSFMGVPLKYGGRTVGMIALANKKDGYGLADKQAVEDLSVAFVEAMNRKQAEKALKLSEEKFRSLVELSPDAILMLDMKGAVTDCNTFMTRGTGYSKQEIVGKHLTELDFLPQEHIPKYLKILDAASRGKVVKPFEVKWRHKDGTPFLAEVRLGFIKERGKNIGVQVVARDITERKKAEEKIKESLAEKEVMLREIHHRVKNNMQIISSLLRLQSRQIKNKETLDIFNVSQNRIRSMALVHESLYRSGDLARINFSDYIRKLTLHLFSIYRTEMDRVKSRIEVGDVFLDINRAIPCGLIINELVSNALKYAFPNNNKGEILVKMNVDKKGKYTLVVKDTGIGFPPDLDFRQTETLGMQLVNDLTAQLEGKVRLKREGGTEFKIVF
ncbi:MAG: PAS domain S-box protein [Candidatus Aminicenantales bacterium]